MVKDLTNLVFVRLTALRCIGRTTRRMAIWLCRCSCDLKEIEVRSGALVSGHTQSCGCIQREKAAALCANRVGENNPMFGRRGEDSPTFKHGGGMSRTYTTWRGMIQRCTNPNEIGWSHYGGANPPVIICDRWHDFQNFLADMGERPEGTSLGRFGDVGPYEKSNCAWQNKSEQVAEQKTKRQLAFLAA